MEGSRNYQEEEEDIQINTTTTTTSTKQLMANEERLSSERKRKREDEPEYEYSLENFENSRRNEKNSEEEGLGNKNEHEEDQIKVKEEAEGQAERDEAAEEEETERKALEEQKKTLETFKLLTRGGVYVPPFKIRKIMEEAEMKLQDAKNSRLSKLFQDKEYQNLQWTVLAKKISSLMNKVSRDNIATLIPEFFKLNLQRGKGLFVGSLIKAQHVSSIYTPVFTALLAVINTRIPEIGELCISRLILKFRKSFARNDKASLLPVLQFFAEMFKQKVLWEVLIGQMLGLMLSKPTNDSVELSLYLFEKVLPQFEEEAPQIYKGVLSRFRVILEEGEIEERRIQFLLENMFLRIQKKERKQRKPEFLKEQRMFLNSTKKNPAKEAEDDDEESGAAKEEAKKNEEMYNLVPDSEKKIHEIRLDDQTLSAQDELNYFHFDPDYEKNEEKYEGFKQIVLGLSDDEDDDEEGGDKDEDEDEAEEENENEAKPSDNSNVSKEINTEFELTNLKRQIYLQIMSSLSYEENAHKLMKSYQNEIFHADPPKDPNRPPTQELIASMIMECAQQEKTFMQHYSSLAERLCFLSKNGILMNTQRQEYPALYPDGNVPRELPTEDLYKIRRKNFSQCFEMLFQTVYFTSNRLDTRKIRNSAMLFSHLLYVGAISWKVFKIAVMTPKDSTSGTRIFLKILFQRLLELMGIEKLIKYVKDETIAPFMTGLFPMDPKKQNDTRFAINFFFSIGLNALTQDMREFLNNLPKLLLKMKEEQQGNSDEEDADEEGGDDDEEEEEGDDEAEEEVKKEIPSNK